MREFDFIKEFMAPLGQVNEQVELGIGDDAAIIRLAADDELVVSTDTQVEGRHFPSGACNRAVICRAIGCAVSDLAAMGALPIGFTLSLTLPSLNVDVAREVAAGVNAALKLYDIALVGGDTVQGPRAISLTVMGRVKRGEALRRSNGCVGDDLWVTGSLGGSAAALEDIEAAALGNLSPLHQRYWQPPSRLTFGHALSQGIATSCLDLSDGFAGDVRHLMEASKVGAEIEVKNIPIDDLAIERFGKAGALELALRGGDDYELLFSAPVNQRERIAQLGRETDTRVTRIGTLSDALEILMMVEDGHPTIFTDAGYSHF